MGSPLTPSIIASLGRLARPRRSWWAKPDAKDAKRSSECSGKNAYPTRVDAVKVLDIQHGKGAGGLRVYKCPHCGDYHLGGGKERKKR